MFTPVPNTDEVRAVLLSLYRRRSEAIVLRRLDVSTPNWKPQPKFCYDNVEAWTGLNPLHKPTYGFLYFDYRPSLGFIRFTAHGVIEIEDGTLRDITPTGASRDYPFIRHLGSLDEFKWLVEQQGMNMGLDLVPQ